MAETLGLQEKKVTLLEPTLSKSDDKKAKITSEFLNKGYYMFFDGAGKIEDLVTGLDADADPRVTIIPATQGGDNSKFKIKIKGGDSGNDKFFAYTDTDVTLPREVGLSEDSTKSIVWELLEGSKPDYIRLSPTGTNDEGEEFLMYDMRDDVDSSNHKLVVENIVNMTGLEYKCNYQSMDILLSEDESSSTFTKCS